MTTTQRKLVGTGKPWLDQLGLKAAKQPDAPDDISMCPTDDTQAVGSQCEIIVEKPCDNISRSVAKGQVNTIPKRLHVNISHKAQNSFSRLLL